MLPFSTIARLFLCSLLIGLLAPASRCQDAIPLTSGWSLQSSSETDQSGDLLSTADALTLGWHKTDLPTTVLAALVQNNVYPDPYYGDNLTKIPGYQEGRWLSMPEGSPFRHSWWFAKSFNFPESAADRYVTLHFDGINYQANIWLNGKLVAGKDQVIGMFRRFQFDVTKLSKPGQPQYLAVEIIGPGQMSERNFRTKQVEATTGWDDHNPQPPDLNMGIWEDVFLVISGPVRVQHPYVAANLEMPSLAKADLTVSARLENLTDKAMSTVLSGTIETRTFAKTVDLAPRETKWVEFTPEEFSTLKVENPRVWWPQSDTPPEMYKLELEATVDGSPSDTVSTPFGIRDATTYINTEGWRGYRINGKNILIRGGAWMTCDMMLQFSDRRYDALVRYAREANLNMLRSEGFSIRETDEFYDACDRHGVMVTQQIFGRSIPDEALAIACIEDTILRIRNHPSLVHFLGHDETFPTPTLDKAYKDLIARYTPQRTYQPHSGAFDVAERFETGGTRTGTRELWTYAHPGKHYLGKEDGAWGFAQSGGIGGIVAPLASLRRMMPEESLWPPTNDIWSLHTVIQGVKFFDTVFEQLNLRYGEPSGIEDFEKKAMMLNYECARAMFESYGQNKYHATGITTWKYDAAWPAAMTWQYVDWYLNVGGAYYGAKKACEPLHGQYSYGDDSVYVVNSHYEEVAGLQVQARLFDFNLNKVWEKSTSVDIGPDGVSKALDVEWTDDIPSPFFLDLRLRNKKGVEVTRNFYWLATRKDAVKEMTDSWDNFKLTMETTPDFTPLNSLPRVGLRVNPQFSSTQAGNRAVVHVHNPTGHLAFGIHLAITRGEQGEEVLPCYWEDNYFSLLPGEERTVTAEFNEEDLGSSTPVVSVGGWNTYSAPD